ncbi:3949_t:CDS:2 [Paraglomus occultum]|uniref:3949_t:CDS:1 n=1 Tax=Paraglomus occultum TaxID=144539 RepID=A0A9N9ACQ1_9GLOM|nr:3949_t:CDS:2 [Paraglomus occultum]
MKAVLNMLVLKLSQKTKLLAVRAILFDNRSRIDWLRNCAATFARY